jgi:hypothetical protein
MADEHFEILLNVLHFKTKNNFYTKTMYEAKDKYSSRRYNKGHSLVDQSIVSVGPLPEEYSMTLLFHFAYRGLFPLSLIARCVTYE